MTQLRGRSRGPLLSSHDKTAGDAIWSAHAKDQQLLWERLVGCSSLPFQRTIPARPSSCLLPYRFRSLFFLGIFLHLCYIFLFVLGNDGKNLRGKIKCSYNVSPREHRAKIQCCFCSLFPMPVSHKMRLLLYTFMFWLLLPFYYISATLTCYEMLFKNNFSEWGAVFKFSFSFCLCFLKKITILCIAPIVSRIHRLVTKRSLWKRRRPVSHWPRGRSSKCTCPCAAGHGTCPLPTSCS